MRIAFTADNHFCGKYLAEATATFDAILTECEARSIRLLCVCGDFFDKANIGDAQTTPGAVLAAINDVIHAHNPKLQLLLIPGDHDQRGFGQADALNALEGHPNARVIRRPSWHITDGVGIACIPWNWNPSPDKTPMEEIEYLLSHRNVTGLYQGEKRAIIAHVQLVGGSMGASGIFDGAKKSAKRWNLTTDELEILKPHFNCIKFGDFHGGGWPYCGAPFQHDQGDATNDPGFWIWDTETNVEEHVSLKAFAPTYRRVTLAPGADLSKVERAANERIEIVTDGWKPTPAEWALAEQDEAIKIKPDVPRVERATRTGAEIEKGIVNHPHAMLDLYAASLTGDLAWSAAHLAGLHGLLTDMLKDKATEGATA